MPYMLEDLVVNRVDIVDEGANSAAFIELFKRKEQSVSMDVKEILSKMKPEHATVIEEAINKAKEDAANEVTAVQEELNKAKEENDSLKEENDSLKEENETLKAKQEETAKELGFDEEETMKSMPEAARQMFAKMKQQKEVAEEELRKAKDAEIHAEAVAKAKELKAIPVEQDKLVGIIKGASADVLDLLTVVNAAIEGTVLDEVGKSHVEKSDKGADAAWSKIEAKADEVAKRDGISKAKAITQVIKAEPELYREYLQGGAN